MDTSAARERDLPGEEGVWVFIGGDLLVFSLMFGSFLYYRAQSPAPFTEGHLALDRELGLLNTLLLLTSSLLVAVAVNDARQGLHKRVRRLLAGGIACSVAFCATKAFEYSAKIRAGFTPSTNDFFGFYYMLTGMHLGHVLFATAVLLYMWRCTGDGSQRDRYISVMESGAVFWHLVDLLWVVLFALLYLLP